ncbi:hypothetical protein JTB14_024787 [Gonioctena quinquepunctata]|nr:hypothetical protein JTB14_024787 [Gonioctena quinquepunctata]
MDKFEDLDLKSKIFIYFNEQLFNHMLNASKEGIFKFKGDSAFHLYHAMALMLVNRLEEGIHELETIRMENEIKLAVTIALMYSHKCLGVTNKELYSKLDGQMREYHKAFDYVEKALNMDSSSADYQTLKGWILLKIKNGRKSIDSIKGLFQSSLIQNPKNLTTIIGLTECYLAYNDYAEALNIINKAVVRFSSTNLPLIQKIRLQIANIDLDQAIETITRVCSTDPKNLITKKLYIVILMCRSETYIEALSEIEKFLIIMETTEPGNIQLMLEVVHLFSKICRKNDRILSETSKVLELAVQNNSDNANLIVEMGHHALLRGRIKEALRYFKNATKIDETSFDALLGLSLCELAENGITDQLGKQIEFLLEMKDAQESPQLHFLQALVSSDSEEALKHLITICENKLLLLKNCFHLDHYLIVLDPCFLLDIIKECLQHISTSKNSWKNVFNVITEVLNIISRVCPGLTEALYLLAKLQYIKGDDINALSSLEKLQRNTTDPNSDAQLLMAQIQVKNGMFDRATQSLEVCVSHNFKVRENPIYHYITALVDKNANNYADAIRSLSTALNLVNIRSKGKPQPEVSLVEKASIYVELIDTLNIVGQTDEALKVLEDATQELRGTPEEARILLLSAEHSLTRKNVQVAMDLLSRIKPTDSCYKEAKSKHAEVLLKYRKDKHAFLQCYLDFVNDDPCQESYVTLGDAYMKVLEPDEALQCFEKALKDNPKDTFLTSKMGRALVETHYFSRAVSYYKETIEITNDMELKLQLAELYMNLREYEKGELILLNELEEEKVNDLEDITYLREKTRLLHLLSQIQEKSGNTTYAMKSLKEARDNQNRIRKRIVVDQNAPLENEVKTLIGISIKLGEMAIALRSNEQAINFYKEGIEISPNNTVILVALAKLYMQMNYLELCQQTCTSILKIDPYNETASVMMADIAFRKVDFDMAQFHFTQLVTKQPTNWEALIRLIEILRRTGNIEECQEYLSIAEKKLDNPSKEMKFLYCTALYQWYSGNLNGALRNFNSARQDVEFGQTAIYNMIEICLNPDDGMFADQFMDSDDIEYKDSRSMALKTADRLLRELKQKLDSSGDEILKYRLLSNFRLLATKEKFNIERAIEDFVSLASQNAYRDNIGITLGIATGYTLMKQGQRAKNQLKRIVKSNWTFEDAEYLERCWLLLADYYIQSGKYDIAIELINKVTQHNKACARAYEYLGFIAEKEQHYKEAANNYEQTWKLGGKSNPSIGFKLAYCLMKCKKYPDAIVTAQEVLRLNPEYPRVKKDILEKCMNNLRI